MKENVDMLGRKMYELEEEYKQRRDGIREQIVKNPDTMAKIDTNKVSRSSTCLRWTHSAPVAKNEERALKAQIHRQPHLNSLCS